MVRLGTRVGWCALSGLLALALARDAVACGGGGVTTTVSHGVVADAQRVFMSVKGARTEVVVQVGVPETTADYGVLIPVPGEPTLDPDPVDEADLVALDSATAPAIVRVDESGSDSSSGCGCIAMGASDAAGTKGAAPGDGVSITEPVNIGPVSAVVLDGSDGDAVNVWLADNGFVIPEANQPLIGAYAGANRYFIAVRRNDRAAPGSPSSIGLHYSLAGDHRMLSLGFARLGAASSVAFTFFLAMPRVLAADPPFQTLSLDDLDGQLLRAGNYRQALADAVAVRESRAFVREGATLRSDLATALSPKFNALIAENAYVTRLSTVVAAEALGDDATFTTPHLGPVQGERYVSRNVSAAYAGFGALFALMLAGALRRRPRTSG